MDMGGFLILTRRATDLDSSLSLSKFSMEINELREREKEEFSDGLRFVEGL